MVPTGLGAFLSNVLFSLELRPPSTLIWPLQTIYRGRGVKHRIHERDDLISMLEPERVIQPLACALQRPTRQSRPAEKPRIKP